MTKRSEVNMRSKAWDGWYIGYKKYSKRLKSRGERRVGRKQCEKFDG